MKPLRILLYAVNGLGLGHITRQLAIAKYLRRYATMLGYQVEISFLSTSEVDTLPFLHGFPVFKIPSKTIIQKGALSMHRYQKLAKMMIWNCIAAIDPHILVVDTFASGSFDELYDVMDFGFKKVFIYRPRKDQDKLWKNPITKAYNRILYLDEAHETDAIKEEVQQLFGEKIHVLGTIVQRNREEMLPMLEACRQLGLNPNQKKACILAGGGGDKDNQAFFERIIELLAQFPDTQFVIGAGPLYLGAEIPSERVRWFYRADISLYWNAFDYVIAAGGYNSVNELLHAQKPALFFAQDRLYDDQEARIQALAAQGLCLQFSLEESNEQILAAITEIAKPNVQATLSQQLLAYNLKNQAGEAALEILKLVESESEIHKIEELLDMAQLQRLQLQGLDELTICKCIRAFAMFQEKINLSYSLQVQDSEYIDNEELLDAAELFLMESIAQQTPKSTILQTVFEAVKLDELSTLNAFNHHLITTLKTRQPYEV